MKFGILKNEFDDSYKNWIDACKKHNANWVIIDLTLNNWLNNILKATDIDGYLACPPGRQAIFKQMYDERIYIIEKIIGKYVFPSYKEISIHENKKYLSYWLKSNNIPHPETNVFYQEHDAKQYINNVNFPIVSKMNIGASGKGVKILKNKDDAKQYINQAFSNGIRSEWGPNLKMGGFTKRILKLIKNPKRIKNRIQVYNKVYNELQKNYVIFQEYIKHDFEWRIVKIGESFFGHKKIKQGEKASGTKGIDYNPPTPELLNFVNELCAKHNFSSMAVDLFEDGNGGYLVNELQCIFGHVQAYICEKDGKPGRFIKEQNKWKFEEGLFNSNLSYNLRLEEVIKQLSK